jgi:hypothetical protein
VQRPFEMTAADLYRDVAMQATVTSAIHFAHTALADLRKDFIRAKFFAWGERHGRQVYRATPFDIDSISNWTLISDAALTVIPSPIV